ncbi:DUF2190 family protein [Salinicola corii]|uniref:DUF2190 family protein n=1 Tax=Salinicola corii TaxID=2606937 RepID=A0A640W910_9GAMM|nr:capsid cement protein [Salinicola corii]KAA0015496.1 DUF2190 family protein [Salinicola corii]
MAKNFNGSGKTLTMIAPAGGVTSGIPVVLGALVLVPLDSAAEGEEFVGHTYGEWKDVPCASGLVAGASVSMLDDEMVAAGAADSAGPIGALTTDAADGVATVFIVQGLVSVASGA